MKRLKTFFFAITFFALFFSCASRRPDETKIQGTTLSLTFAGDIMAHNVNSAMADYSLIYADITDILQADDLSFANFESPVHSGRPYESYPTFNVQGAYVDAAIQAGFDVFSLANNHTNDQGREGILETQRFFESRRDKIHFAGIKTESGALTYTIIDVKGWKVLFVAITELLNSSQSANLIDYIAPTKKQQTEFVSVIKQLRADHPCDVFVLSLHSAEEEYVPAIADSRRSYYYDLLDAGVDILWANHPHITKERQIVYDMNTKLPHKMIMYSVGNTISGQRTKPDYKNPANPRDNTGDSYLFCIQLGKRANNTVGIIEVKSVLITTHIDEKRQFLIKKLDDTFIKGLRDAGNTTAAAYYEMRRNLMSEIQETILWR